jgi:hypothetical protein
VTIADPEKYLDAMAAAIGITVPEEHRAGTLIYLRLASAIARPLVEAAIDETVEPAPIFRPEPPRTE